jgi:ATP-dependent Clp protease ATP-binding subunit ClpA
MGKKAKSTDPETVLEDWIELDLSEAAALGKLKPALGVDDLLARMTEVIAGGRNLILSGEPGVGKTSLVHELARRLSAGGGPEPLRGKRLVQISFRSRAAALKKAEEVRPAFQELVSALIAKRAELVPFIRDIHFAYNYDCEPQLERLALRFEGVILGEADVTTLDSMFQYAEELELHFLVQRVVEPNLTRMHNLLQRWAEEERRAGRMLADDALETALELSHRFLSRSHMPRKAVDVLQQVQATVRAGETMTASSVVEYFESTFHVPRLLIDPECPFDPVATEALFQSRVLFQEEAVAATIRIITAIKAGLSDPRRPFGAFLFVGPTGVGKTHLAQLLAEFLFGSRDKLVRINMADHQGENAADALFGSAYGSLRERRGSLTLRLAGHHFAVLLLDEFEKTHTKVHDRFLQLIDEGAFINGAGETISCRSMIVVATSNTGAEVYRRQAMGWASRTDLAALDRELDKKLAEAFRHEFLNRFDQVVHFHPLPRRGIRAVALREVEALSKRVGLRARRLTLEVDESVLDWLAAHGYDPHFGARFLRRSVERNVTSALSELLVQEQPAPGSVVQLGVRSGRIHASYAAPAREGRESILLPSGKSDVKRSLDREELQLEANKLLATSTQLFATHQARRSEAAALLDRMGRPGFWDQRAEAERVLSEYRRLDVATRAEERVAQPLVALSELVSRSQPIKIDQLARAVERAARALNDWEDRTNEEGPARCWLLLRNMEALDHADEWLADLTRMLLAWSRRLHLSAEAVAFGFQDEKLARVVLEVEGPGAASYMAMEKGVHRLKRAEAKDQRVRVNVALASTGALSDATLSRVQRLRRARECLGLRASVSSQIALPDQGQYLELFSNDRVELARLVEDLQAQLSGPEGAHDTARLYADGGQGARDPRTGASIARYKDVLAGKLYPLLDAWRAFRRQERAALGQPSSTSPL